MTRYRLHYFPESGNSYKLALMLTLSGERFEGIWTDFGGGVTRTREWRETVNEMGEIPVLEEDGDRLTQTAPILLRLAERRIDDAYLSFPKHEACYDVAQSHPAIAAWLARLAGLPGWKAPYDLLPGQRLRCYV